MMCFETKITEASIASIQELYAIEVMPESINIQKTKRNLQAISPCLYFLL